MKPQLFLIPALMLVVALLTGCEQDSSSGTDATNGASVDRLAANSGTTDQSKQSERVDTRFAVTDQSVTLVGKELSRNNILSQIIEVEQARLIGGPIIDRIVSVEVQDGHMGEVLAQLLADLDYQASFSSRDDMRSLLTTLWIGEAALEQFAEEQQVSQSEGVLAPPIVMADGSLDAGEKFVRKQIDLYQNGGIEHKQVAINDLELSEGGVVFLSHIIRNEENRDLVIAAIQRLDLGEEFAARWALLDALNHADEVVLLEALNAIEVWRDPTIRKYLQPLTEHSAPRVRERAVELIQDINIYAELELEAAARPLNLDAGGTNQ